MNLQVHIFVYLQPFYLQRPLVKYYQMSPPVGLVLDALGSAGTASCFYQLAHIIPWISLPLCIFFITMQLYLLQSFS